MVQKSKSEAAIESQSRQSGQAEKPQMIARVLMALGLALFWILVGDAAGTPGLGLACGLLGAAFIFTWTSPRRP